MTSNHRNDINKRNHRRIAGSDQRAGGRYTPLQGERHSDWPDPPIKRGCVIKHFQVMRALDSRAQNKGKMPRKTHIDGLEV